MRVVNEYGYIDQTYQPEMGNWFKKLNPINVLKKSLAFHKKALKVPLNIFKKKKGKPRAAAELPETLPYDPAMQAPQPVTQSYSPYPQSYSSGGGGGGGSSYDNMPSSEGNDDSAYERYNGQDETDSQENADYDSQQYQGNYSSPDDGTPDDGGMGFVWFAALAQAIGKGVQKLKKSKAVKKAKDAAKKSLAQSLSEKQAQNTQRYKAQSGFKLTPVTIGLGLAGLAALAFAASRGRR